MTPAGTAAAGGYPLEGGCACGSVRYALLVAPMFVHCCHCSYCQRETGSAFVINALVEAGQVDLRAGRPRRVEVPTVSGRGQGIVRCPECHVALWSHYAFAGVGEMTRFLRVGTLDEPARLPPDIHIFTSSRLPWVAIPPEQSSVTGYYDTAARWPDASLERLAALKAAHGAGPPR